MRLYTDSTKSSRLRLTGNHLVAYNTHVDEVFKALSDPSRRILLDSLFRENGQALGALCVDLKMSRQAVTKHLAILEAADLVVCRWRGREKLHYLNPVPIREISDRWINKFEQSRLDALINLKKEIESDGESRKK